MKMFDPSVMAKRFWSKVDKSDLEGCWIWTAGCFKQGYGAFSLNGKAYYAHRVAYRLTQGSIPTSLQVCHTCDNPPCCNPDHLFLGTQLTNMQDMALKGRQRGTKLNWEAVLQIRASDGLLKDAAKQFGISESYVSNIRANRVRKSPQKLT